jgi:hypothetical protein
MKNTLLGLAFIVLLVLFASSGHSAVGCQDGEYNYDNPGSC